jgi:hypothetical protein
MFHRAFAAAFAVSLASPGVAQTADDLLDALKIEETVAVMQAEGRDYGRDLADNMLGGTSESWEASVARVYDVEAMEEAVRTAFREALPEDMATPLLDFFTSDLGQEVVTLEIEAREAMVDEDVEDAARERYRDLEGGDDVRLGLVEDFVEANDLVEQNVSGALNASFAFYNGLADGGALEMSESEMLSEIWSQEEDTRNDTTEWVHAYLLMAYGPLSEDELTRYVELSESEAGRALNRALFAGFNAMYNDISYAMGLAAASEMAATDL